MKKQKPGPKGPKKGTMANRSDNRRRDLTIMRIPLGTVPCLSSKKDISLELHFTEKGYVYLRVPAGRGRDGKSAAFRFSMGGVDALLYSEEGEYRRASRFDPCRVVFQPGRKYNTKGDVVLFRGPADMDYEGRPCGRHEVRFWLKVDDVEEMLKGIKKILASEIYQDMVRLSLGAAYKPPAKEAKPRASAQSDENASQENEQDEGESMDEDETEEVTDDEEDEDAESVAEKTAPPPAAN